MPILEADTTMLKQECLTCVDCNPREESIFERSGHRRQPASFGDGRTQPLQPGHNPIARLNPHRSGFAMQSFVYNALPGRVVFGSGTIAALQAEIERAGCKRALLLSTPEQATELKKIAASIGPLAAGA